MNATTTKTLSELRRLLAKADRSSSAYQESMGMVFLKTYTLIESDPDDYGPAYARLAGQVGKTPRVIEQWYEAGKLMNDYSVFPGPNPRHLIQIAERRNDISDDRVGKAVNLVCEGKMPTHALFIRRSKAKLSAPLVAKVQLTRYAHSHKWDKRRTAAFFLKVAVCMAEIVSGERMTGEIRETKTGDLFESV